MRPTYSLWMQSSYIPRPHARKVLFDKSLDRKVTKLDFNDLSNGIHCDLNFFFACRLTCNKGPTSFFVFLENRGGGFDTEIAVDARPIDVKLPDIILTNTLLPEVGRLLLQTIADGDKPAVIRVGIGATGAFEYNTQALTQVYSPPLPSASAEPATA